MVPNTSVPTRTQLTEAAALLFADEGYASVSVRDLARRSGMTTGAIYSHFRSKADLLVSAIEAMMVNDVEKRASNPPDGAAPPEVTATAAFASHPDRVALRALLIEGAVAARQDAEVRTTLKDEQHGHLTWWTEYFRNWQRNAGIDEKLDVEALVMMLWSIELGLGVLEAMGFDPPSPEAWSDLVRRFLAGVAQG